MTINSVSSTRRQAGAEYLLLDSGAQLHACPITHPGQKIPLLDPGIHTASGAILQHDGGRLVTYKLQEGRTIRVLFHACEVLKPILSLGCPFAQTTGTLFFLDKVQTKHSQTVRETEDVVGVVIPLCGVAQAFHGDQVVELRVQLAVKEVEGKEEDREGQVEVEEEKRLKEVRFMDDYGDEMTKTQILSHEV